MVVTRHAAEPMSKEAGTMSCNTDSMNMTTKDSKLNGDESNNEEEFVVYRHSRRKSSGITNSEEADHIQSDKQNSQGREEYLLRFRQKRSQRKKTLRNFRSMSSYDDGSSEEDGIGALASDSPRKRSFPNMLLRRSGRTRKAVYSTLNASAIEQANHDVDEVRAMEHQERRSKSNNAVEQVKPEVRDLLLAQGKDPTELDKLGQPDIYSSIKSRQRLRRPRRFFDDDDEYHDQNTADRGDDGEKRLDNGAEAAENGNVQEHQHDDEVEGDDDDDDDDDEQPRRYSLRTKRPQTQRLVYELEQQQQHLHRNRPERNLFEQACIGSSSARRKSRRSESSRNLPHAHESTNSPYQHKHRRINSQGASSSETTSQSEDESKFKRRKERSMMKARNRCLPMNLTMADVAGHGFAKERKKIGSSLADVDPMAIDKSVKFSSIGGHDKHLRSLKEMVVFPLLYPEVFEKFNIQPPRGCLFYGPPGTGKTLMARALANECSSEGRKVAFFMRKGADCLSKWVGESERQLRLLFDQAYQMRPSIIFFDEIDGLAPVRSSRQDQIHSSIVSTLLALMDGLDSRGEIVVIGATNRIDSIDPALRRPGRFDREFLFPLPDKKAREEIIRIHTHNWNPPLDKEFVTRLAEKSAGYCGADVKALCTESALIALRHRYPQIYSTNEKLKLDLDNVRIGQRHFIKAMQVITPTAQRSVPNPAHPLSPCIKPLVEANLARSVSQLAKVFPLLYKTSKILQSQCDDPPPQSDSDMSDDEVSCPLPPPNGFALPSTSASLSLRDTVVHRPRYLVCGNSKDGLGGHLVPALLHDLEGLPVHTIDIPTIYGSSARTPEEGCAQIFREAQRTAPSVIYLPDAPTWWSSASNTIQFTFESLLRSIPASSPVLLIATATCSFDEMCRRFKQLFAANFGEVFVVTRPTCEERSKFFAPLFLDLACRPPRTNFKRAAILEHEVLEKAAPVEGARLTEKELEKLEAQEESTMRSLRLFLRDVLTRLAQDRRFKLFLNPVDVEEVEDYLEVIKHPMDLSTMMNKIDKHCYGNVTSFVQDIDLICSNALEYNPERYAEERAIRHRACLLKDMCHAIVEEELAPTFERFCNEVCEARTKRRAAPEKFAPSYCHVLPRPKLQSSNNQTAAIPTITGRHRLSSELSKSCRKRKRKLKSRWAMGIVGKKTKKRKLESEEEHTEGEEAHGEAASTEEEDEEGHADGTEEKDAEGKNEEEVVELEDQQVSDVNMSDEDDPHPTTPTTTPPPQDAESDTCGDDEHSDDDEEVAESDDGENHEEHAGDEDGEDGVEDEDHEDHVEDDEGENHDDDVEDEDHEDHVEDDEGQESDEKTARIVPASSDNGSLDQDPKLVTDPKASAENCPDDSNEAEMPEVTSSPPTPVAACDVKIEEVEENGGHIADAGGAGAGGGGGEMENEVSAMKLRPRTRTTEAEKPPVYVPRPTPPVVVDRATLQLILNDCVRKTSKFRVDELERIFSLLAKTVHEHRSNYDKTLLTQELEQVVQSLSRPVT